MVLSFVHVFHWMNQVTQPSPHQGLRATCLTEAKRGRLIISRILIQGITVTQGNLHPGSHGTDDHWIGHTGVQSMIGDRGLTVA